MSGSRLALVADDAHLANAIGSHLQKTLGQSAFVCKFASIREHLGPDTDGVLVLVAATPADAKHSLRIVQEVTLQRFPSTILVDAGDVGPRCRDFALLERHLLRRLRSPDEASPLALAVKDRLGRGQTFSEIKEKSLEEVIGRRLLCWTPSLMPMVDRIALAASHDVTVLLTGETGTGKTYLARLIHDCSARRAQRVLAGPCGALSANLVESEFFGHVKGSFTGADRAKVGKFAAAGDGTLLLDEIDALGLEQQANLLRVIETGEFEPVGSNETQHSTARIVV